MLATHYLTALLDQLGPDKFAGFHRKITVRMEEMRALLAELIARRGAKPIAWLWRKQGDPIWNLSETKPEHLKGNFEIKPVYEEFKSE